MVIEKNNMTLDQLLKQTEELFSAQKQIFTGIGDIAVDIKPVIDDLTTILREHMALRDGPLINKTMIGGNHLASVLLGMGIDPPTQDTYEQVQKDHGQLAADIWVAWKAIMDLAVYRRQLNKEGE